MTGLRYRHFNSRGADFQVAVQQDQFDCGSVNNSNLCITLQANERASHFVRDPRDLIVSGYHYHQWCVETWANRRPFRRAAEFESDPLFQKWMPVKAWPVGMSYQQFLNSLKKEQGLILEMIWRKPVFTRLRQWNFSHPQILEMKYEEIIGHETDAFSQLFEHYGLNSDWKNDWLAIVDANSLKNIQRGARQHARNGGSQQFRYEFTNDVMTEFNVHHADLLQKLGYAIESATAACTDAVKGTATAGAVASPVP